MFTFKYRNKQFYIFTSSLTYNLSSHLIALLLNFQLLLDFQLFFHQSSKLLFMLSSFCFSWFSSFFIITINLHLNLLTKTSSLNTLYSKWFDHSLKFSLCSLLETINFGTCYFISSIFSSFLYSWFLSTCHSLSLVVFLSIIFLVSLFAKSSNLNCVSIFQSWY